MGAVHAAVLAEIDIREQVYVRTMTMMVEESADGSVCIQHPDFDEVIVKCSLS